MNLSSFIIFIGTGLLVACNNGTNENSDLKLTTPQHESQENSGITQLVDGTRRSEDRKEERRKEKRAQAEKPEKNSGDSIEDKSLEELTQRFIEKAEIVAARRINVEKALDGYKVVKALPAKGLHEAHAKCEKISELVGFLKETSTPKKPFDGLRHHFRKELVSARDSMLKENGVKSCGAVKNLLASLPTSAPEAQTLADEAVPEIDLADSEAVKTEQVASTTTIK